MKTIKELVKRNIKLFFKDKAMFFTSLITPIILLVLYSTFLGDIYRENFISSLPKDIILPEKLINSLVGGQIISSILAVSCVTVSFCSNMLMVQDKVTGVIKDFNVSPIKPSILAISYYFANLITSLLICYSAFIFGLIYLIFAGWYLSILDILLIILDITLLVLFGNAFSSIINFFLKSQGQISAVGTIISSGYGFICGAYMPISSFKVGLQKVISCLPGTYGTVLIRNHTINSALLEIKNLGVPLFILEEIKNSIDCNIYFFGNYVSIFKMYLIFIITIIILLLIYIFLNKLSLKKI